MPRMLASFVVTVAVVVPTAWHALEADIETDGKKLRPLQQSFTIGDTVVTLDIDRSLVVTGDTIKATLVAYSDTPKPITVDLALLHSNNYAGERVEQPLAAIDREKLTLIAAPGGGKPVETALVLGTRPDHAGQVDDFKVYVTAHGRKPPAESEYTKRPDYRADVEAGTAAAIGVMGWSGNNLGISIKPEGPLVAGRPVTVDVRIVNTSGHTLRDEPSIQLATQLNLDGYMEPGADVAIEAIYDDNDSKEVKVKRGEVVVRKFVVTPAKTTKQITFVATATASDGMPGPTIAGAMDAHTFAITEPTPEVAAR